MQIVKAELKNGSFPSVNLRAARSSDAWEGTRWPKLLDSQPKDGLPTGYTAEQTLPGIAARDGIIENPEALKGLARAAGLIPITGRPYRCIAYTLVSTCARTGIN